MQKKHFFLGNKIAEVRSFTPRTRSVQPPTMPERNRQEHAAYIKEIYNTAIDKAIETLSQRSESGLPVADGVYMNFDMVSGFVPQALAKSSGASILKISEDKGEGNVDVTIYIKKEKKDWLDKKANEYANEEICTINGNPKNATLIEPINSIEQADIHSLYTSAEDFDMLPDNHLQTFEIWVTKGDDYNLEELTKTLDSLGLISAGKNILDFDGVAVLLIKATKQQLCELPLSVGYIEGIRPYKQPSILVKSHNESREWSELIKDEIEISINSDSVRVGLLDSGVNNAHELIAPFLSDDMMKSAIGVSDTIDHSFHGTDMAGLILYGDMTDLIYGHKKSVTLENNLASVKIYESGYETDSDFYGAVIEDAIQQAHEMGASIQCMAVTDDISYDCKSTSSSAALDESIYNGGNCDRLVVVSAGNIETTEIDASDYIESIHIRYNIIEQLYSFLSILKDSPEYIKEIFILINEYVVKRRERVDLLNKEIGLMLKKNKRNNIDYSLHELVDRIHFLENKLTGSSEDKDDCLWSLIKLLCQKDFSIFAEAGYGKTHFACSLANNMLNRGLPILFLTGSQFRNCSSCESKLLEILNLPQGTLIDDIFDSMNFMGEIFHCKFPIIIDGLNESAPNEQRWKDELPPLRRKITERKNLLFITTCREKDEYIEVIYGRKKYTEVNNFVHLNGIEEKDLDKATERYFKKYNIHPTNIISSGVFNNPLLLKVFCITNRGRCDFELNDYSLASCMKDYSEQLLNMIATHNGRSDRFKRFKIESNLNKISQLIWERNNRCLNFYTDFASVFEEDTEKFLDEGMCFLLDRVGNEEQIQFSYDMVAGYHIAKSILDKYNDAKDFCNFIERNKDYLYGINRHTLAEDISKSLFYLVPLKFHKEWYELMPNENVIISSMDHLDIIIASESGRKALITLIEKNNLTSSIKEKICNSLFKRVYNQSNLKYISLFVPFFLNLTSKEFDLFWNFQFSNYSVLEHEKDLLSDRYWTKHFEIEDIITLATLLCGITDMEYRKKYHSQLFYWVEQDNSNLIFCQKLLSIKDPFIFESIISIVTGIGLRAKETSTINNCISILEDYLANYNSNHIVLLDDLETLYSYGEDLYGQTYDRNILYKNRDEFWRQSDIENFSFYQIYDYDYEKFNIRPLYAYSYKHEPNFTEEEVFGMLLTRILELGYDEEFYTELQTKENENSKYRRNQKCNYAYKYGRHALMELYGWMMLNLYIENEYKGTFRSSIIDIDPSSPCFKPLRSLITKSYMPRNLSDLPEWIKASSIEDMRNYFIKKLPKNEGDWILLKGYCNQNIENRYAHLHISGTSQLVPSDLDIEDVSKLYIHDIDHNHAFAGELGWRILEFTEEYDDFGNDSCPLIMAEYEFSGWDTNRFNYNNFFCLNPIIVRRIGLTFDLKTMTYYYNNEKVSEYFINESDHFFYLRKDIVDAILNIYNVKLYHRIYERRIITSKSKDMPEIPEKFAEHEIDLFYDGNINVKILGKE